MKKSKLILLIIGVVLVVAGITYAAYTWIIPNTMKITGSSECFDVKYVKGKDIGSDNDVKTLMISDDYKGGLSSTLNISFNSTCTIKNGKGTLYLNTDSSTSSSLLESGTLKYQIMRYSTNLGSGVISSTGQQVIASNISLSSSNTITVYVWIDATGLSEEEVIALLDTKYKGSVSMKIESGDK